MSTGFPTTLDSSSVVGDAVAAIETRLGVTGSDDPNSVTYQLSLVVPQLPHRTGGTLFVHSATGAAAGSNMFTLGTVYAIPMYIPGDADYSAAGIIRTNPVAGSYERLGIYSDGGGVPDTLLYDFGRTTTAATNTGFKYISSVTASLEAGWVWLACCPQGSAVSYLFSTIGTSTGAPVVLGTSAPSSMGMTMGYSGPTAITDSLPQTWGSTYTEQWIVPIVYLARA